MKNKYLEEVLYTRKDIQSAIKQGAKWANSTLKGNRSPVVVLGILNGCIPFFGQILTQLKFSLVTDFIRYESFAGAEERQHEPRLTLDIQEDVKKFIKNKVVLVVDDVLSSGATSSLILKELQDLGAKDVKFLFLLEQKHTEDAKYNLDYHACISVPNKFLVGYGLDYKERYRNLDCIGVLKEKYAK